MARRGATLARGAKTPRRRMGKVWRKALFSLMIPAIMSGTSERCPRPLAPNHIPAIGGRAAMATAHSTRVSFSARQRSRISQLVDEARRLRQLIDVEPCVYCGVAANSIDHVPPRSARERIVAMGLANRYPFQEVFACRECNSVLGARGLWTLTERRSYVKAALRRRYSDVLRIPDWTDSELGQVSPSMRQFILDGMYVRDFVRARVAYQEPMSKSA